jgi:hypothetical protein
MPLLTQKYQIAVEIEADEGTAETLAAADVILAFEPKFTPGIDMHKRSPGRANLSAYPSLPGNRQGRISFGCELTGTASAGDALHFTDALQACGVLETLAVDTSATYTPASDSIPSVTVGMFRDGKRKRIWGARGNCRLVIEVGKPAMLMFDFQGADWDEADASMLSGTSLASVVPPVCHEIAFSIDSYSAIIGRCEIDFGNRLALRPDANSASGNLSCIISGREATVRFDPEDVLAATEDFFGAWRAGSELELTATLGSSTGNTHEITCPAVQYHDVQETEREGASVLEITGQLNGDSGDDEWQIHTT